MRKKEVRTILNYAVEGQISIFDWLKPEEPPVEPKPHFNKEEYQVIKVSEMKILHERNFVEICTDSRICISATVKHLENNMVYWKEWYTYPFLNICKSEKEAGECYKEHLDSILNQLYQPPRFEVIIPVEMKDMYLCVNGIWSCDTYTFRNGAVRT